MTIPAAFYSLPEHPASEHLFWILLGFLQDLGEKFPGYGLCLCLIQLSSETSTNTYPPQTPHIFLIFSKSFCFQCNLCKMCLMLICIWMSSDNLEHFMVGLLLFCVSENYPFISFIHFSILCIFSCIFASINTFSILDIPSNFSLSLNYHCWQEILNFDISRLLFSIGFQYFSHIHTLAYIHKCMSILLVH